MSQITRMKLTYIKALVGLYVLIFLSSLLQSCCNEIVTYTGSGYMTAYYNENEQFELDTINKEFYMRVQFDQEWIVAANYSLMDQAYATSCVYEEQNRIAFGTLKLTSANSFIHKDKLIPARFNLFEMEALDTLRGHWSPDYLEITFHQEFVDSSDFSTPSLMLQLSGSTNDNQPILIKKEIWIK